MIFQGKAVVELVAGQQQIVPRKLVNWLLRDVALHDANRRRLYPPQLASPVDLEKPQQPGPARLLHRELRAQWNSAQRALL